jgi:hypothetical protein
MCVSHNKANVYPLHLALNEHYCSSPLFMNRKPDTQEEFLTISEREKERYFVAKKNGELYFNAYANSVVRRIDERIIQRASPV